MTEEEILFLQGLCQVGSRSFGLRGNRGKDLHQFDEFVEHLRRLEEAGWIELEVTRAHRREHGYPRRYRAASARCTDKCREALRRLRSA